MEDLQSASKLLVKALEIRERYMRMSQQVFPSSGVNFTNVLCAAFMRADPKSVKFQLSCQFLFTL